MHKQKGERKETDRRRELEKVANGRKPKTTKKGDDFESFTTFFVVVVVVVVAAAAVAVVAVAVAVVMKCFLL